MPILVLINGAPGAGKSTIAERLAAETPRAVALDIDALKQSLNGWEDDPTAAGLEARRLALAVVEERLATGHSVFVGQFLTRPEFISELERLAQTQSATFVEILLVADVDVLRARLGQRTTNPERPANRELPRIVEALLQDRASAHRVDATMAIGDVAARVAEYLRMVVVRNDTLLH